MSSESVIGWLEGSERWSRIVFIAVSEVCISAISLLEICGVSDSSCKAGIVAGVDRLLWVSTATMGLDVGFGGAHMSPCVVFLLIALHSGRLLVELSAHSAGILFVVIMSFSCRSFMTWGQKASESLDS